MPVQCISSTALTMFADVLRNGDENDVAVPLSEQGTHKIIQDPWTGEINRAWVPVVTDNDEVFSIKCSVQGILDGGIRVAGTTERFDKIYDNVDFAHMIFPSSYILTKRDRITNVRNRKGTIIWVEEELNAEGGLYPATVFDVLGVTPITDMFGNHVQNRALLARADLSDS